MKKPTYDEIAAALKSSVEMLEDTQWARHHCQCAVESHLPIGSPGCPCQDHMAPLRELVATSS